MSDAQPALHAIPIGPVMCVVGARPNFMKIAPILRALAAHQPPLPALLVHTGQHYDASMSDRLFADLNLPQPDLNLEVGSASHAVQTAEVMKRFEPALDMHQPSCVLVVGDVNSTLACTLVAVKKGVPVVHVEAGLRSYDRKMPEEINRVLTDQVADRLYTTERSAAANLQREGVAADRIVFTGNVMIDSLLTSREHARPAAATLQAHDIDPALLAHPRGYGAFPRILRKYVREEKLLSLEEAIRKMTALPAQRMRLADRGVLKAGMWADVVVFNPDTVRDVATFEDPNRLAEGMEWVLVNGVPVIARGKLTGALPGRVLRGPGASSP